MATKKTSSPLVKALAEAGLEGADLLAEVKRAIVNPGDLVVFKTIVNPRPEFANYLRKQGRRLFPGNEVIVLGPDVEIEIVAEAEAEGVSDG